MQIHIFITHLIKIRELQKKMAELLQEEDDYDTSHPKHLPPLCCNRIKDYYEWLKECKEYDEKKKAE